MKIRYLAFPTSEFPCFGFVICSDENGNLFLPEYEDGVVAGFKKGLEETDDLYQYPGDQIMSVGSAIIYAYRLDDLNYFFGTMEQIHPQLLNVMDKIDGAPFSKLKLAEFLRIDEHELKSIQDECYDYLYNYNGQDFYKKQAKIWALENSYDPPEQLDFDEKLLTSEEAQGFQNRLTTFLEYCDALTDSHVKASKMAEKPIEKIDCIQAFLQALCRGINLAFFDYKGVRTHFRYLYPEMDKYLKLAAAHDEYNYYYGMTGMPATGDGMIFRAALYGRPLIYTSYKEFHYGREVERSNFKDYITFVLMDDDLKCRGRYMISMGISISSRKHTQHINMLHLLRLHRFDHTIVKKIKYYSEATEIDIVKTIAEHSYDIWERFDSVDRIRNDNRDINNVEDIITPVAVECPPKKAAISVEAPELKNDTFPCQKSDFEKKLLLLPFSHTKIDEILPVLEEMNNKINSVIVGEMQSGQYSAIINVLKDDAKRFDLSA